MTLIEPILQGDRRALARLLTQVENNTAEGRHALQQLFMHTGRAHLVGVTGAPGTGKSSLVNQLARHYRTAGSRVAIAAVDPSSPFTGGAVLGDRVRMKDLSGDSDVFIRSMASRGALGGLARATAGIVRVFDAAGYDHILIETVGAGQGEVDIVRLAHTTLVVEAPGLGDDIQAIKAGILEIADILVINKADRPGVENTEKALRSVLDLSRISAADLAHHGDQSSGDGHAPPRQDSWEVPIQRTVAINDEGISELVARIAEHRTFLERTGSWLARERERVQAEMALALQATLLEQFHARVPETRYNEIVEQVFSKRLSPGEAIELLVQNGQTAPSGERARSSSGRSPRSKRAR
jgi:LAO/AO transport system kinase